MTTEHAMKERDRLAEVLFSPSENRRVLDVKFFLGDDRNVTEEDIYLEANSAERQLRLKSITPTASIDRTAARVSLTAFVKSA